MRNIQILYIVIIFCLPGASSTPASGVTFLVNGVAHPSQTEPRKTVKFAATVKADSAAIDYAIGMKVFLGNAFLGNASQVFPGVSFRANRAVTRASRWSVPAEAWPGNYTLLAGVFDTDRNWQTRTAISFIVGRTEKPGLSRALSASPPYTCVTNYYVDGVYGDDGNPGTQSKPWKTIQNADNGYPNRPTPGECVNVLPGIYRLRAPIILGHGGNSNTPTGYVVYRSTVPQGAHIVAASTLGGGDLIMLTTPYIVIDGFNIDGNGVKTSGSGIGGCAGGGGRYNIAHHFVAINNIIHDMGGAGLASCTAEYITWAHNVVYNTSSTNLYQVSGIDLGIPAVLPAGSYSATAGDDTRYHIVIAYNIAYNNSEGPAIPPPHTDGNGIIIDTTLGSSTCSTCGTAYPSQILVLGNLAYGNGGGGIHVFLSQNVTVANNTVYNNYRDVLNPGTPRGELSNGGSENITWINNIAIAVPGSGVLAGSEPITTFPIKGFPDSGIWAKNISFGAPVTSDPTSYVNPAANLIGVNPQLRNPAGGNFVPLAGSPALGAGQAESYIPSLAPNIGAF
jgi:parallel beta-helix repeat protein